MKYQDKQDKMVRERLFPFFLKEMNNYYGKSIDEVIYYFELLLLYFSMFSNLDEKEIVETLLPRLFKATIKKDYVDDDVITELIDPLTNDLIHWDEMSIENFSKFYIEIEDKLNNFDFELSKAIPMMAKLVKDYLIAGLPDEEIFAVVKVYSRYFVLRYNESEYVGEHFYKMFAGILLGHYSAKGLLGLESDFIKMLDILTVKHSPNDFIKLALEMEEKVKKIVDK